MVVIVLLFQLSCKKDSCENCPGRNKPPVANAGSDTSIILPVNAIILDGSKSFDPDGIETYTWKKIAGPATFNISNPSVVATLVDKLVEGTYLFELMVTDKRGLSFKDPMAVIVNAVNIFNHAPVAHADKETSILLPINILVLDGSQSSDPDNNIINYSWLKISGPASATITNTTDKKEPCAATIRARRGQGC